MEQFIFNLKSLSKGQEELIPQFIFTESKNDIKAALKHIEDNMDKYYDNFIDEDCFDQLRERIKGDSLPLHIAINNCQYIYANCIEISNVKDL